MPLKDKSGPLSVCACAVVDSHAVYQSITDSLLVCVLEMGSMPEEQLGFQAFWKMLFQPCMA